MYAILCGIVNSSTFALNTSSSVATAIRSVEGVSNYKSTKKLAASSTLHYYIRTLVYRLLRNFGIAHSRMVTKKSGIFDLFSNLGVWMYCNGHPFSGKCLLREMHISSIAIEWLSLSPRRRCRGREATTVFSPNSGPVVTALQLHGASWKDICKAATDGWEHWIHTRRVTT